MNESPPKEDRRVRKTKAALRAAIVSEVAARGYEAVTVEDIAASADVTRASFYKHFANKEELLADVVSTFASEIRTALDSATSRLNRFVILLEHAQREPQLSRIISEGQGDGIALRRFLSIATEVLRDQIEEVPALIEGLTDEELSLSIDLEAARVMAGMHWFLHTGLTPAAAAERLVAAMDRNLRWPD